MTTGATVATSGKTDTPDDAQSGKAGNLIQVEIHPPRTTTMGQHTPDELDAERRRVADDHLCDCETCRRGGPVCPASASSLIDELAQRRIENRKLRDAMHGLLGCLPAVEDALDSDRPYIAKCVQVANRIMSPAARAEALRMAKDDQRRGGGRGCLDVFEIPEHRWQGSDESAGSVATGRELD